MAFKINAKDCCGDQCQIGSNAPESTETVEEEIRGEKCCSKSGKNDCCSKEWPDD